MAAHRTALVVGGTGPTGPYVVNGLVDRGYDVTMLHTGRHEDPSVSGSVRHLHTDPFEGAALESTLGSQEFDVAVVMYGRLRVIAELLHGRVGRFISVGGVPAHRGFGDPASLPAGGLAVPTRESGPRADPDDPNRKIATIVRTEEAVFTHHPHARHFRFPVIYGPRQLMAREWMVVRRILDGRRTIILPDGGSALMSTAYSENAAHALLCAVDREDAPSHGVYNVSDEWTPTVRQWVTLIAAALDHEFEIVDIPFDLASVSWPLLGMNDPFHRVFPMDKAIYELGYRDVVPVEEGLRRTARWLVENPLEDGGSIGTGASAIVSPLRDSSMRTPTSW